MSILKTFPLLVLAALLLIAVACKGGSGDSTSNDSGDNPALVFNATEALAASADRFQREVGSVNAEFTFEMESSLFSMSADGKFMYSAPDQLYMTMEMGGGDGTIDFGEIGAFEMLLRDGKFYMYTPFTEWLVMSPEDMGEEAASFQDLLNGHSPFDYQTLVDSIGGNVEVVGEQKMDGGTYQHLRVTADMADVLASLSDSLGSTGDAFGVDSGLSLDELSGPIVMDVWVDAETLLPHKLSADGTIGFGEQETSMVIEFTFLSYNEVVQIPAAPEDAKDFGQLLGLGGVGD